tara:strand:+ start:99 stop:488 length:390 start_codon:yes stop_codon:yes gene_type:complete
MEYIDLYKDLVARARDAAIVPGLGAVSEESNLDHLLTDTEQQVLVGISLGLSAKEIAKVRECSNRTIEGHAASIKLKLRSKRLPPALVMAYIDNVNKGISKIEDFDSYTPEKLRTKWFGGINVSDASNE